MSSIISALDRYCADLSPSAYVFVPVAWYQTNSSSSEVRGESHVGTQGSDSQNDCSIRSLRRDDPSTPLNSNPRRPLPLPPSLPGLGSPFVPHSPVASASHTRLLSPIARPRASPAGPRPLQRSTESCDSGAKASRWRKKKKREEMFTMMGSGSSHDLGSSSRTDRLVNQDWSHPQPATRQLPPDHGLNPFAASFRPAADFIIKARSMPLASASQHPVDNLSNFRRDHSSNVYSANAPHLPSPAVIQAEALASIGQDIHHLRQWSSLFQIQSFTFPEYQNHHYQSQPQIFFQRPQVLSHHVQNNGSNMVPSREAFATPQMLQSIAVAPRFAPHAMHEQPPAYYGHGNQSQPMDSRRSSLPQLQMSYNSGGSESTTSTPASLLADLVSLRKTSPSTFF